MKMEIVGIFLCMLIIATVLPCIDATDVKTTNLSASGFIGIKIVAKVYNVDDPNNLLGGVIHANDTITGKYVYDSGIPDSDPDTSKGHYPFTSSTCKFEVFAGGLTFKNNPSNMDLSIWVYNNHIGNTDEYSVLSLNNLQLSNGMLVSIIQWDIQDFDGTALDNDALPTTAPVLTDWELNTLILIGKDPDNPAKEYAIYAKVNSATKSSEVDIDEAKNGGLSVKMPFQYNLPFIRFWMRLFEQFLNISPILRFVMR